MHVERADDVITVRATPWQVLGPWMMMIFGAVVITFLPGDTIQGAELLMLRTLALLLFAICLLRPRSYRVHFDFKSRRYERTEHRFWRREVARQAGELSDLQRVSVRKSPSFPARYDLVLTGEHAPVRLCVMYRSEQFEPGQLDALALELSERLSELATKR